MIHKSTIALLSSAAMLITSTTPLLAASAVINISPSVQTISTIGDFSSFNVEIEPNGERISAIEVVLTYDPNIIKVNSIQPGNFFTDHQALIGAPQIISIDTDKDLIPNHIEIQQGSSPNDGNDFLDTDGDGVPNYVELIGPVLLTPAQMPGATTPQGETSNPNDPNNFPDENSNGITDYEESSNVTPLNLPQGFIHYAVGFPAGSGFSSQSNGTGLIINYQTLNPGITNLNIITKGTPHSIAANISEQNVLTTTNSGQIAVATSVPEFSTMLIIFTTLCVTALYLHNKSTLSFVHIPK